MSFTVRIQIASAAVAFASLVGAAGASAASFQVNTGADSLDGICDSSCSIRDAAAAAAAVSTDDIVQVPPGYYSVDYGPIPLAGTGEVEVEGPNPRVATIDAHGSSSVFVLSAGVEGEIKRVTITGGAAATQGGAIFVPPGAEAEIEFAAISGNTAGEQGGGIYNEGELELVRSTVNGNSAGDASQADGGRGGGVYNAGEAEMENVTVTGNQVIDGTSTGARGGGIFQDGSEAAEYESLTVSHNVAGANGTGAGFAIAAGDSTTLANTIVANNQGAQAGSENCSFDVAIPESGNLEEGGGCGFTGAGDKHGVDPLLGPLQNNQGFTDTRALAPGSPALDALDSSQCPRFDQRTMGRPQGPRCDIGAFEVEVGAPAPTGSSGVAGSAAKPFSVGLSAKSGQRILRQRGVIVSVDCDRACTVSASGRVEVSNGASRVIRLRKASKTLTTAGRATLKLRLSKKALASVRTALRKHKRMTASVSVQGKDSAGITSVAKRKIRLRR